MDSLKQKLKNNESTIGSWITIGNPIVAEIMSNIAFDWLVVDMEHSVIELKEAQQLVQIIENKGCVPLVRVSENNENLIKRVMDTGAHGVIVPMVNSRADAEKAVRAVKYPPRGTRGTGIARAQRWQTDISQYLKWNEEESIIVIQIEHFQAVKNIREILHASDIDAFIIGIYDISASLGVAGQFDHPLVVDALDRVMDEACRHNIVAGIHVVSPNITEVMQRIDEGYRFIAFSTDFLFIQDTSRAGLEAIRRGME